MLTQVPRLAAMLLDLQEVASMECAIAQHLLMGGERHDWPSL